MMALQVSEETGQPIFKFKNKEDRYNNFLFSVLYILVSLTEKKVPLTDIKEQLGVRKLIKNMDLNDTWNL